jgi:hypothetical protein
VVSRRLPTATVRVRAQIRSCGIYSGQRGTGGGFLRVLRFPLPILIPPTAPHSSSSSGAGTIGQLVADVPSGLSLTPLQEIKKKQQQRDYQISREQVQSGLGIVTVTFRSIECIEMKASRQVCALVAAPALCSQLACCVSTTAVSLIKTEQDGFIIYHAQTKQQITAQVDSSGYASCSHSGDAWFESSFPSSKCRYNSSKQTITASFHNISNQSLVNNHTIRQYIP